MVEGRRSCAGHIYIMSCHSRGTKKPLSPRCHGNRGTNYMKKRNVTSVHQEDILSIWNRTSNDQMTTSRIRDTLRRVLNLPTNTIMEYKTHNDSLR